MLMHLKIFQMSSVNFSLGVIFDFYSVVFSLTVLTISLSVCMFSLSYMNSELNMSRFYKLIFGFVMSMMILIFSSNLLFLMMGWDGLGILSFLLVIFYQNESSLASGLITFMTNRVGDAFLLCLIALMGINMNWTLFNNMSIFMFLIFFLGSTTKSAQMPFCVWLPRAMSAPTPISALVHSSTLVTAGVFLLIRFSNNMDFSIMLTFGSLTSLVAGLASMVENDFKKIIALSTLSQLGVMFMSLGLNMIEVAFFHLCTHAFFKAMIFICAGDIINCNMGSQDVRLYGMIFLNNPILSMFLLTGNLALMGLPFLAGFYSKDAMLEEFMISNFNMFLFLICWMGVLMTSIYSTRMVIMSMWLTNFKVNFYFKKNILIIYPLCILSLGAIMSGSILSHFLYLELYVGSKIFKIFPFIMMISGMMFMIVMWNKNIMSSLLATIMFLKPSTENLSLLQNPSSTVILTSEYGWMEVVPQKFLSLIVNIKTMSCFISMLSILFLLIL